MDVFAFRDELVAEYERFSRSFTRIRADDISRDVDAAYAAGRFWPAPLIQLNPNFEPGGNVNGLVLDGTLLQPPGPSRSRSTKEAAWGSDLAAPGDQRRGGPSQVGAVGAAGMCARSVVKPPLRPLRT